MGKKIAKYKYYDLQTEVVTQAFMSDELKLQSVRNEINTGKRMQELGIPSPFPSPLQEQCHGLQPVREGCGNLTRAWRCKPAAVKGLLVLASVALYGGEVWYHVSVSRATEIPTYHDCFWVKNHVIGRERKAIMILPPESEHINIQPNCLHFWANLERDPLPDFRTLGQI